MSEGIIFDIKQLAVYDGPGIRTTVFLKGCPLKCMWCHNPEGISFAPQLMVSKNNCLHCGMCERVCRHMDEKCVNCGECVLACPNGLRRIAGTRWTAEKLAGKLLKSADYLNAQGGGVTFSGGEPTAQSEFLLEMLERLSSMHRAIETSGYCRSDVFSEIVGRTDYIMMDLKVMDSDTHLKYTGVRNELILENLEVLKSSGKPFRIRIPVIPGVNDSEENFRRTAEALRDAENLEIVELLPYHVTAGAKYEMIDEIYSPEFDTSAKPDLNMKPFLDLGINCTHL